MAEKRGDAIRKSNAADWKTLYAVCCVSDDEGFAELRNTLSSCCVTHILTRPCTPDQPQPNARCNRQSARHFTSHVVVIVCLLVLCALTQQPEVVDQSSLCYAACSARIQLRGTIQRLTEESSHRPTPGGRRRRQYGR